MIGYVAAFVIASLTVSLYIALTGYIDRVTYSGMSAFGDSVVFLAAFGLASIPATGGALLFLRPYRMFWLTMSVISLALAITSGLAATTYLVPSSTLINWYMLAPLRLLAAPLFAVFFALCGVISPKRSDRFSLLLAAAIEMTSFAIFVFMMVRSTR